MATRLSRENILHRLFDVGVLLKGIDGFLEIVGGLLFLFVSKKAIGALVMFLTQHELTEDPSDVIANSLRHMAGNLSSSMKLFGSAYLIGHGIVKVFLAIELLRNKLWSYPASVAFLVAFIGYQMYRLAVHYSPGLLLLTCLDIIIVILIWREYKYAKRRKGEAEDLY